MRRMRETDPICDVNTVQSCDMRHKA